MANVLATMVALWLLVYLIAAAFRQMQDQLVAVARHWRRHRLAGAPRHGDHQRRVLRHLRRALPQDPCRPGIGRSSR